MKLEFFIKTSFCVLFFAVSCTEFQKASQEKGRISPETLKDLKNRYSKEAINYFYETAFYQDYVGRQERLIKWKDHIFVNSLGDLWPGDSIIIQNTITSINALDLPIKLQLTEDSSLVNTPIYFGEQKELERILNLTSSRYFQGAGLLSKESDVINQTKIGISNNATSYKTCSISDSATIRNSIILEELSNSLGIVGDSWRYKESIFFEGPYPNPVYSELDKEIIRFLYEPGMPTGYTRKQFEADFGDVLHHINAKEKVIDYAESNKIPVRYFESIAQNCFQDSTLLKYPTTIFLKLSGDFDTNDISFCNEITELFNEGNPWVHMEYANDNILNEAPSINIVLEEDPSLKTPALSERFINAGSQMFPMRLIGTIKFRFNRSLIEAYSQERKSLLVRTINQVLGFDHLKEDVIEFDPNGKMSFKPGYKELLSLYYNPVIPDGFTLEEMNEVIQALKEKSGTGQL
ncbi:hypothetical protein FUAX_45540 (plasmid) [Fulvitalea axinellae]|uniref:Uncharacterized protein n=1 Tax=Fulvitalea axinellae TaxID=1182444 RepID=A0AAU9CYT3_9BACT|nr:hypothetical protein FUAX_45540 [Fulvitalea axinellae]